MASARGSSLAVIALLLAATPVRADDAVVAGTSSASDHSPRKAPAVSMNPGGTRLAAPGRPLDLAFGDLRRFVDPKLLESPVTDGLEEIIVNGRRPEPLPEHRQLPRGLGSVVYAVLNPTQAWRIVLPEPHAEPVVRDPDAPRESPGAFRARIPAPGRIYE